MTPEQRDLLEASIRTLIAQNDRRRALEVALGGGPGLPGYGSEFRRSLYKRFPAQEAEDVFSQFAQQLCAALPSFQGEAPFAPGPTPC